ncbi:MAG: DUF4236 domain-containing protein [Synergistaceae bacterium]|nr:DUF4236 domain-containing protein [Synergistaceae bacterium]
MGLRFRKSFKLFSGLKLNIGKKSISTSFGGKGFSINTGTNGTFIHSGLPGTGISYRSKLFKKERTTHNQANSQTIHGGLILGFIIGAFIFLWSRSFLFSFLPVIIVPFLAILGELEENARISRENTYIEEEYIQSIKRKERAQQQLKVTIISPCTPIKEDYQSQSTDSTRKLLPLLEVDKIQ